MSQVWHLFRNDLRASKHILTVWFGALAAYVATAWRDPLTLETNIHASAIGILTMVVAVVAAAMLIQQDSLVGVRPFWMTRPIRWWSLLGAKALFGAVFLVGAQLFACTALLVRFGASPGELPFFLVEIGAGQVWLLAVAVLLATVTTGATQFITVGVVAYVGTIGGIIYVDWMLGASESGSRTWPFGEWVLLTSVILIPMRYSGLSRWKTCLAIMACWTGIVLWPVTGWAPANRDRQSAASPLAGVSLEAGAMNLGEIGYQAAFHNNGDARSEGFVVRWKAQGLDANHAIRLDELKGQIHWDDGEVTGIQGARLGTVRGSGPISSMDLSEIRFRTASVVTFDQLLEPDQVYGKQGRLKARLTGWLQTMAEYGSAPLVAGAAVEGDGYAVRVESVSMDDASATILFRERRLVRSDEKADWPEPMIFRRDTGTRLLETGANRVGSATHGWVTSWPVIEVRERELIYEWHRQAREIAESGPRWLADAELTVIGYAPVRRVSMEVDVPNFRVIRNQALERRSRMPQQQGALDPRPGPGRP